MTHQQCHYLYNPAFGIYRLQFPTELVYPETFIIWSASAETPPVKTAINTEVVTPIAFDGPLDFLGAEIFIVDDTVEIDTWWQVKRSVKDTNTLSIMAHMLNAAGENFGIAEGLGIAPSVWSPGDILIQRHRFPGLSGAIITTFLFCTGLYWLENGQRMSLSDDLSTDAIYIQFQ